MFSINTRSTLSLIFILSILSVFPFQNSFAQVDIHMGEEFKAPRSQVVADVAGLDETGVYIVKKGVFSGRKVTLEALSPDLNLSHTAEYEITVGSGEPRYEKSAMINGNLALFTSSFDRKNGRKSYYLEPFNKKTLKPLGTAEKIFTVKHETSSNQGLKERFIYSIDPDNNYIAILAHHRLSQKGAKEGVSVAVFDKDLNKVWDRDIKFATQENFFDVEQFRVDQKGRVYLLGIRFQDQRSRSRKGEPNYDYQILRLDDAEKEALNFDISLDDKFITDLTLQIKENGEIVCGGFYSERNAYQVSGSCFMNVDPESGVIKQKALKEFDLELITETMNKNQTKAAESREKKGKNVDLFKYELSNLVLHDDGRVTMIGEQVFFVPDFSIYGAAGLKGTFNYNEIIVVRLSPEGIIEWAHQVQKEQRTEDDNGRYSSFALAESDKSIHLLFNDNPKNLTITKKGKVKNFRPFGESMVVIVSLDKNGEMKKYPLFSSRDADVVTIPKLSRQVNRNELVIVGKKGSKSRFSKITF